MSREPSESLESLPSDGRSRARRLGGMALKLALSVGILAYLVTIVPLGEIGAVLRRVDPVLVLLALALIPISGLTAAMQQKVLTDVQGMRLSVRHLVEINLVTRFYDLFLPGSVGALMRWRRMSLPAGKPAEALAAIAFNRGLETLIMVALGLGFWLWARPPGVNPLISAALIGCFGALLLVQGAVFNRRFASWGCRVIESRHARTIPGWIGAKAAKVLRAAGVYDVLSTRTVAYLASLSVVRHLAGIVGLVLLAHSIGIDLTLAAAGWIDIALALIMMLPISVGGLGVREASLIVFLQGYGVPPSDAIALSVLLLTRKVVRAAFGGVLELRRVLRAPGTSWTAPIAPGVHVER